MPPSMAKSSRTLVFQIRYTEHSFWKSKQTLVRFLVTVKLQNNQILTQTFNSARLLKKFCSAPVRNKQVPGKVRHSTTGTEVSDPVKFEGKRVGFGRQPKEHEEKTSAYSSVPAKKVRRKQCTLVEEVEGAAESANGRRKRTLEDRRKEWKRC